jgi:flagellar hook protein FlgE
VQGWMANNSGVFGSLDSVSLSDIRVPRGDSAMAQPTTTAGLGGNLNAGAAVGNEYRTSFTAYDSLGRAQSLEMRFTKTGVNSWDWTVQPPAGVTATGGGTLTFNTDGTLATGGAGSISLSAPGAAAQTVATDFTGVTQGFTGGSESSVLVREANGYPVGTLESVSIDASGTAYGVYSNGFRRPLAQVALANFVNLSGLLKVGSNGFAESSASGAPQVGKPNADGRGRLVPGNLEGSNVDISTEFTNMIVTQRGFQANTRVITAADEMIQDLVNLRR